MKMSGVPGTELGALLLCSGSAAAKPLQSDISLHQFVCALVLTDKLTYAPGCDDLHVSVCLLLQLRNWADVLLIAPLSANTSEKLANGLCDYW
jgi:Flavoprotein